MTQAARSEHRQTRLAVARVSTFCIWLSLVVVSQCLAGQSYRFPELGFPEPTSDWFRVASLSELRAMPSDKVAVSCDLPDKDLPEVFKIAQIKYLRISKCSSLALKDLGLLKELEGFYPPATINNDGLKYIAQCTKLKLLSLRGNVKLRESDLAALKPLTALEALDFAGCEAFGDGVSKFVGTGKLKVLSIRGCKKMTVSGLEPFLDSGTLEWLEAPGVTLSDATVKRLSLNKNLNVLYIGSAFSDDGFALVAHLTKLTELYLNEQCGDVKAIHLAKLINLEVLWLFSSSFTDEGIARLNTLTKLKSLVLHGSDFGSSGFRKWPAENLEELQIWGWESLPKSDELCDALTRFSKLKKLVLPSGCLDSSRSAKIAKLSALEYLDVGKISDVELGQLGKLRNLRYLRCWGDELTEEAIEAFKETHPDCKVER